MRPLIALLLLITLSSCAWISRAKKLGRFSMDSTISMALDSGSKSSMDTASKKEATASEQTGLKIVFEDGSARPCPENKLLVLPDGRLWASGNIRSAVFNNLRSSTTTDSSGKKETRQTDLKKDTEAKLVVKTIDRTVTVTKKVIPWWCYLLAALGLFYAGWRVYKKQPWQLIRNLGRSR